MSLTITQESSIHLSQVALRLESKAPEKVSKRVHDLVVKMEQSFLLSSIEKEELLNWKEQYDSEWLNEWEMEEAKENISLSLCLLLFEVIRPAICKEENFDKQLELLDFEDSIKSILQVTVPTGEKVDPFIEKYDLYSQEEKDLDDKFNRIEEVFEREMEQLYTAANKWNSCIPLPIK